MIPEQIILIISLSGDEDCCEPGIRLHNKPIERNYRRKREREEEEEEKKLLHYKMKHIIIITFSHA